MKGKFAGSPMHIEYHNIDPKKEKAADCIYLTTDRICQNKESQWYLGKCFIARDCPCRVREKEAQEIAKRNALMDSKPAKPKKQQIKKIKCSIPMKCIMYNKSYGNGRLVGYDENSMIISVRFGEKIARFQYPDAILEKHIIVPKFAFNLLLDDLHHAEKE